MLEKLNHHEILFVDGIEAGKSLVDAYMQAGYRAQRKTAYAKGSKKIRQGNIIAELDRRMSARRQAAHQRFGNMADGATNIYLKILKLDAGTNERLLALQAKVSSDIFDRIGLKPKDEQELSGTLKIIFDYGDRQTDQSGSE